MRRTKRATINTPATNTLQAQCLGMSSPVAQPKLNVTDVKNLMEEAFKERERTNVQVQVGQSIQAPPTHASIKMTSSETQAVAKTQLHLIYSLLAMHQPQKFFGTKDIVVAKKLLKSMESAMFLIDTTVAKKVKYATYLFKVNA